MSDNNLSNTLTQFQDHVRKNLKFYVPLAAGTLGLAFLYYYGTSSSQALEVDDSAAEVEPSLTEEEAMTLTKEDIEKLSASRRQIISKLLKDFGNENFRTKQFQAAIENYSKAIELHEDPVYYCNRAAGYSALKQHQKVIEDCTKTLSMHPEYTKAIVRRAQAYEATSQYQLSLNDYVCGFFLAESNHQTASLGIERTIKVLAAEQAAAEALPNQLEHISVSYALHYVNCFEKVTLPSDESDDNEADKKVREAIKLIDDNKFSEAHKLLQSAVQADTKFMVEALNLRCMFDIIVKDWDSANEGLKKALEINPDHVQCRIKQSNILTETGDVSGAFESLKELQTQHPESYEVHFHLAQIYFILEQVDMAQACYQTAMELSPTFEQAHIQYGVSLCYFKPREEAAAFFKKSLETFKTSSIMLNVYAEFLMECGQMDEVTDILDKALAISPNNATVLLNKSIFYLKAYNDLELAAKYNQQAIDIDPAFTTALLNLANIKSIQTKFDEADELLERSKKTIRSKLELEAIISQQLHNKAKQVFAQQYPKKLELLSSVPTGSV